MTDDYFNNGASVDFEWECEQCHRKTHDNWMISPRHAHGACRACRGFVTVTEAEGDRQIAKQETRWRGQHQ